MPCRENDAICVLKLVLLWLLFSINDSSVATLLLRESLDTNY